jgi:DNA-binding MarR family transcriptional regulator
MPSVTRADTAVAGGLRDAIGRLSRRIRSERTDSELSLGQWAALRSLELHGPMTPSELAAHEHVQPPSMTRIVGVLEEHGYVTRTPDPVDRRQVVVAASRAGLDLLTAERRRKDRWISKRLDTLTTDERAALAAALPVREKLSRL